MRSCSPDPNESLSGYVRRMAHKNAYVFVSEFYARLGHRYGRPLVEDLAGVAKTLGISISELEAISPEHAPDEPSREWRFERSHVDPFCPECLAQDGIWRVAWRHCYVTACETHAARLQETCPRCKVMVTPQTGGFSACECGMPFAQFPTEKAAAEEILISSLFGGDGGDLWASDPPGDIGAFVHFLVSSQQDSRTGKLGKMPYPKTVGEAVVHVRHAGGVLSDWPHNFDAEISRRLQAAKTPESTAAETLGSWYQRLMKFSGAPYEPFRARLAAVIAKSHQGSCPGQSVDWRAREWLSAAESARRIGIRAERLVAAVAAGQVLGEKKHSGMGHQHTQVPTNVVDELITLREGVLTAKAAADFLGVGKRHFNLLLELGFVHEIDPEDVHPLVDGRFNKAELEEVVGRISAGLRSQREGEVAVAFTDLTLRRTTDRKALGKVFEAIKIGDLPPVVSGKDMPLGQFEFSAQDVEGVLKASGGVAGFTAKDVSELTGWKHECVTYWCKTGLLGSRKAMRGGAEAYDISPKDLVEFQKRYVVVADLAKQTGSSSRVIAGKLGKPGSEVIQKVEKGGARRCGVIPLKSLLPPV